MNVAIFLIIMLKKITGSVKWTKFKLKTHKRFLIRVLLSKKMRKYAFLKLFSSFEMNIKAFFK